MKIRTGFVSNSSCTSFCIYGVEIEEDEVCKLLKLEDGDDIYDVVEVRLKDTKLGFNLLEGIDCYYIGREWRSIGDDETGRIFKQGVEDELLKVFGKKFECSTIEEAQNG